MATSNLLKVGPTSIHLIVLNAVKSPCHFSSAVLAFHRTLNEQRTAPVRDSAASGDFSGGQLTYIWLTLASQQ